MIEINEKDARFRAIARSAVARAMDSRRDCMAVKITKTDAQDIALLATTIALATAFEGDAELMAARTERDYYKDLLLQILPLTPPLIVPLPQLHPQDQAHSKAPWRDFRGV